MKMTLLIRSAKVFLFLVAVLVMAMDNPLLAQPPGRGGGSRGGASGGGAGGGGPLDFLRRLDANGNGMIDPDEQGRARPFLERMSSDLRLDLSRPIPLERISQGMERMRQGQQSGGSSRGSSSNRGGSSSSGGGDNLRSGYSSRPDTDALIPGFGEEEFLDLIPGFGPLGETLDVEL
ncbi:MAG: hypothetical protein VB855_09585, partial [Pirellulaceae bacterium]